MKTRGTMCRTSADESTVVEEGTREYRAGGQDDEDLPQKLRSWSRRRRRRVHECSYLSSRLSDVGLWHPPIVVDTPSPTDDPPVKPAKFQSCWHPPFGVAVCGDTGILSLFFLILAYVDYVNSVCVYLYFLNFVFIYFNYFHILRGRD